ncbi:Targeting protein for Xklp2 [Nymphon striatum]|nr:Targeting protein for Xklp2 [Nymphon striatum]
MLLNNVSVSKSPEAANDDQGKSKETVDTEMNEKIKSKVLNGLNTPDNQKCRQSPRLKSSSKKEMNRKRNACDSNKIEEKRKVSVSDMQPVAKKLRSSNTPVSMKKLLQKKMSPLSQTSSNSSIKKVKSKITLTLPRTPQVLKRAVAKMFDLKSKAKSSEELELEMMKNYHEKMKESHKQIRKSSEKKIQESKQKKTTFHLTTIPKEFHFATDSRIKAHTMTTRQDSPKDFVSSLRSQSASSNEVHSTRPKVTHPVPFNFVIQPIDKRSDATQAKNEYKSMAEVVQAYHKQTPQRYHTNPKATPMVQRVTEKCMTQPKSPQLLTNLRKRKVSFVSHDKQEELEAEEAKRFQFKANPYNENLFKFPTGIKKLNKPSATKPVPFLFEGDKIVRKKAVSEPKFEFHAQPVPKSVLCGPSNCAPVTKLPLTQPKSPAFALKNRSLNRMNKSVIKPDTPKPMKVCPFPHQGVPFRPKLDKKVTAVEPFTFDERDKEMLVKKEEKIKEQIEASSQIPKFKAQLLPSEKPSGIPEKHPKPVTNPQPFKLLIESRGEEKAEKWKKEVEAELENQRKAKLFKAQPCTIPYVKPFMVKPSQRALTNISSFELNTDRRAGEREELTSFRKSKELEIHSIYEERQKEAELHEKLEVAKLRKQIVHKAQPIKKYKPVLITGSDLELTQPSSPRFSTRNRSQRM